MALSVLFALSNGSTSVLARQERSDDWTLEGARREMSMMAWLTETLHAFDLTWTALLWGLVSFLGMSIGSIAVVALLLVKLPATYFCDACPHDFWGDRHPMIRWTGLILKNLLGVLLVILGGIMTLPGVPGPGILTILLGVMLLNFPGKRRLERWLIRRPTVLSAMNRLRQRYGKPPMVLERGVASPMRPSPHTRAMECTLSIPKGTGH